MINIFNFINTQAIDKQIFNSKNINQSLKKNSLF